MFSLREDRDLVSRNNETGGEVADAGLYRWVVYSVFITCNTAGFLIANTIGILLPSITNDISLSPTEQGILSSAPFWANLMLMVVVSWWTSRYRPKILVSVTILMGAIFLFVQGWAPTFLALFLGRLAFGVTMIAREPARSLLIRQWLPRREINMAGGISNLFFGIIVSGGLLLTPVILNYFNGDWRPTINLGAVLFLCLGVVWHFVGKDRSNALVDVSEPTPTRASELSLLRKVFSFREVWIAGVGFMGAMMAFFSFNSFFPTMALDHYDISISSSGLIIAMYVLPGGFSGVLLAYYTKGVKGREVILVLAGFIIGGTYFGMTLVDNYTFLIGLAILNGMGWGFFPILYMVPFYLKGVQPREIAIAGAVVMSLGHLGSVFGPTVTGYMQETIGSLQISMRIISLAPITLVLSAFLLRYQKLRDLK